MASSGVAKQEFNWKRHVKFFKMCLQVVPGRYTSMDTTRMTVAFFAISGLDMLNSLNTLDKERDQYIDWIYSLQYLPNESRSNVDRCGFRGSSTVGMNHNPQLSRLSPIPHDSGHIAGTYSALLSLLVLGDDLSGVDRSAIAAGLQKLQLPDGSFCPTPYGGEDDMRFVYCACCISHIIDDWSGINRTKTINYIKNSFTYEGAFAEGPGLEAHGGTTFCAVASLVLMGCLNEALSPAQIDRLRRWCLMRQQSGFQGRPNKPVDTCYSFWVGGTLKLLDVFHLSSKTYNRGFLQETEDRLVGGFSKWADNSPDPLHAYFGVCGLSLMGEPGLKQMHAALNVSEQAASHLHNLHLTWRSGGLNHVVNHVERHPLLMTVSHVAFLKQCLMGLPGELASADASRLTVAHFCVCGLDLLNSLDVLSVQEKSLIIDWVYTLQDQMPGSSFSKSLSGFRGSTATKIAHSSNCEKQPAHLDHTHILMTYSALCCLTTLGDDFSRLDRSGLLRGLHHLQMKNGGFRASLEDNSESDLKFAYCAVCICYILGEFRHIDVDRLCHYIKQCQSYEGGFGQGPGSEAHGGATYCAVASLKILDRLSTLSSEAMTRLKKWCLYKQELGFKGRTNKEPQSSYCFWIGASLSILGALDVSNSSASVDFLLSSQSKDGGFSKNSSSLPDPMQTYFSLCGLSLLRVPGMSGLDALLCLSERASNLLRMLESLKQHCSTKSS